MPYARLKVNQMMTIGAKVLEILVIPSGWITYRSTNMAQETPMIVPDEISGLTTSRPGVRQHVLLSSWDDYSP
jgi:hypothetical protein